MYMYTLIHAHSFQYRQKILTTWQSFFCLYLFLFNIWKSFQTFNVGNRMKFRIQVKISKIISENWNVNMIWDFFMGKWFRILSSFLFGWHTHSHLLNVIRLRSDIYVRRCACVCWFGWLRSVHQSMLNIVSFCRSPWSNVFFTWLVKLDSAKSAKCCVYKIQRKDSID